MKFKNILVLTMLALSFGPGFAYSEEPAAQPAGTIKEAGSLLPAPAAKKTDANYKLQPGDKLQVKIYPEDTYVHGGDMEVTPEGNITLPLLGKINVGGKSINEASSEIQALLDKDYLVNPEVVIQIMGFKEQSFVVLGQVRKPGTYQFPQGDKKFTFLQAISMAGGFSEVANIKKIKVIRQGEGQRKIIRINAEKMISGDEPDIELQTGDVIHVSESLF